MTVTRYYPSSHTHLLAGGAFMSCCPPSYPGCCGCGCKGSSYSYVVSRVYRPAEGGERACNSVPACVDGEMLEVTKNKPRYAHIQPYTTYDVASVAIYGLLLVTSSISPSIQAGTGLHALSPPLAGQYALGPCCLE